MTSQPRLRWGLVAALGAGCAAGALVWWVGRRTTTPPRWGQPAEVTAGRHLTPPGTPSSGSAPDADRPAVAATPGRSSAVRPRLPPADRWSEPRDDVWAGPVEAMLDEYVSRRVQQLVPEAAWRGVECRTTTCTLELDCPVEAVELCQHAASILVLLDGMTLRIRQQPADQGHVATLVDVALPSGDANHLEEAMVGEITAHPEIEHRIADHIVTLRRELGLGRPSSP